MTATTKPNNSQILSRLVVLGFLYVVCAYATLESPFTHVGVPTIWPAAGVALAAFLLSPNRLWLGLCVVIGLLDLAARLSIGEFPWHTSVIFASSMTIQAIASAALIRRFTSPPIDFEKPRDVYALVSWGCIVVVAIASIPPAFLIAKIRHFDFLSAWLSWSVASAAGVIIIAPLLLLWCENPKETANHEQGRKRLLLICALIGLGLVTAISFVTGNPSGAALAPLSYLAMLALILIAIFFRVASLTIAAVVLAVVATYFDIQTSIDPEALRTSLLALQSFFFAAITSALLISSLLRESVTDTIALKKSRERFELALMGANDGIFDYDIAKNLLYVSPRFTQMIGYEENEFGLSTSDIIDNIHKDDREKWREAYIASFADPNVHHRVDFRMRHKNGHWIDIRANGYFERDSEGTPIRFAGTHSDRSQQNQIDKALRQSERMETVGQLSGGIAHDFNNLLGIVMGNVELLLDHIKEDKPALKLANSALDAVRRAASLTRKLLGFSKSAASATSSIQINEVIEDMSDLLAKSLTAAIKVEYALNDEQWSVIAEASDLENALLNLALNSKDAMPEGGTLTIETSNQLIDESYMKLNPGVVPGEHVMISISDTGTGMSEDIRDRLFEPFFTTKPEKKGTGLGLSMVYGFVQRSEGFIKVYSEIGAGTTIKILLPRQEKEHSVIAAPVDINKTLPTGSEAILIVDDEEMLIDIVVEFLDSLGYETFSATNAEDALKILGRESRIALLFSDVIIPGKLDGYKLALRVRTKWPTIKVLLTSGFTAMREQSINGDEAHLRKLTASLLSKPYNMRELAFAIRTAIDED